MNEEGYGGGVLTGEAAPDRSPGIDPLDAVAAVARPREDAAPAATVPDAGDGGISVETRVQVNAPAAAPADGEADDAYGAFEWPDGYVADPGAVAKFVPLARRLGLSKDSAQALAGLYAELDQARSAGQAEFIAKNNAEWLREIQRHPEFGGPRLQQTGEEVAGLLRRYGSPLLTAQIRQMHVQNWPEMFYFLARLARASGEDRSPATGPGGASPKSTAQLLFPGLK